MDSVTTFCSISESIETHEKALADLEQGIKSERQTLSAVVEALGPFLTHTNPLTRARGVLLLSKLLEVDRKLAQPFRFLLFFFLLFFFSFLPLF
jgi:hypothetical protein